MISPSAAASTEVPAGAGMSIASWVRPSERASLKVSISCSRRTPATGMIKFSTPTKPSGEAAGVACGVITTEGSADGLGEEIDHDSHAYNEDYQSKPCSELFALSRIVRYVLSSPRGKRGRGVVPSKNQLAPTRKR